MFRSTAIPPVVFYSLLKGKDPDAYTLYMVVIGLLAGSGAMNEEGPFRFLSIELPLIVGIKVLLNVGIEVSESVDIEVSLTLALK